MEEWLNSPECYFINFSNIVHLVIMPAYPRFEMYDVLEAHKENNGQWNAGYQAKTKEDTLGNKTTKNSSKKYIKI